MRRRRTRANECSRFQATVAEVRRSDLARVRSPCHFRLSEPVHLLLKIDRSRTITSEPRAPTDQARRWYGPLCGSLDTGVERQRGSLPSFIPIRGDGDEGTASDAPQGDPSGGVNDFYRGGRTAFQRKSNRGVASSRIMPVWWCWRTVRTQLTPPRSVVASIQCPAIDAPRRHTSTPGRAVRGTRSS